MADAGRVRQAQGMRPLYRTAVIAAAVIALLLGLALAWASVGDDPASPPPGRVTIGESPDPASPSPGASAGVASRPAPTPSASGEIVAPPAPVTDDDDDDVGEDDDDDDDDADGDDD